MKKLFLLTMTATLFSLNAQVIQSEASNTGGSSSMAFIDGSSSTGYNPFNGAGKGILFPSTDLTNINAADVFDSGSVGAANYNPGFYDGLVVYNTGNGAVTGTMGAGSPDVTPGFYYYANPDRTAWDGGTWTPMGGGGAAAPLAIPDDTPMDSDLVIGTTPERVVRLSGTADGVSTHIDLGTTILAANTVATFRKAIVYHGTSGHVILEASGSYDSATNIFVTGNSMMNVLLPAGTYTVEVYYTE